MASQKKNETYMITVRVPAVIYRRLRDIREEDGVMVNALVNKAIVDHLERKYPQKETA